MKRIKIFWTQTQIPKNILASKSAVDWKINIKKFQYEMIQNLSKLQTPDFFSAKQQSTKCTSQCVRHVKAIVKQEEATKSTFRKNKKAAN